MCVYLYFTELSEPEIIEEIDQLVTLTNSSKRCKKSKKKRNK